MLPRTRSSTAQELRFALLLGCFFLSGFAALLYETAWTRQFAFVFGATELAVATVLAAYFGGLTFGAAAAARLAPRVRRPVLAYGLLEAGIALAALGVPWAIRGATYLYVGLFGAQGTPAEAAGLPTALFYLVCSFAILFVPTAFMGATLPLLARHAVRDDRELGPRIGVLYAVNTAGAVAGTLAAAFVLLPSVGLRQTILVGVATNALVFLAAAGLARSAPERAPAAAAARGGPLRLILPLVLVSGAASFTYEVLWTRLLGYVIGGSVYGFATMLASFLLGIALGAAVAGRLAASPARAARGFGVAQLATAGLSIAAFAALGRLPELSQWLGAGVTGSLTANAGVAALVLLPGALAIGATFPFAVRILARGDADAGPASARVYAWNTVGAITGSVTSGFFLLPALGFAGTLVLAVALNLGLAGAAAWLARPAPRPLVAVALAGLAGLAIWHPQEPWRVLRMTPIQGTVSSGEVTYYSVGRSATVLLLDDGIHWTLRTNGLPESRIVRPGGLLPEPTANRWLLPISVLARPEARSAMVVGLGGGTTVEVVPEGLRSVDVVELEAEVVEANRHVAGRRAVDPLGDPRVHLHVNDARGALLLTNKSYDAIVSQPSHPWMPGAANLYTREFFELVRARLAPGGVFAQWMGLVFVDEPLLRSLVATLADVFPHLRVYRPERAALLFLASDEPLPVEKTAARAIASSPETFARVGVLAPEDVAAALVLDDAAARRFARDAPLITDDFNRLAAGAPRAMRAPIQATGADRALAPLDPLRQAPPSLDCAALAQRLVARFERRRALRVARFWPDPAERTLCAAAARMEAGATGAARTLFERALEDDPDATRALLGLLQIHRSSRGSSVSEVRQLERRLKGPASAVAKGWRHEEAEAWQALAALEPQLAAARPGDAAFEPATRLRALWRVRLGDPEQAREAMALIDRVIPRSDDPEDFLLRAQAAQAAGRSTAVLASLEKAAQRARASRDGRRLLRDARALLASVPAEDGRGVGRRRVAALLARLARRGGS